MQRSRRTSGPRSYDRIPIPELPGALCAGEYAAVDAAFAHPGGPAGRDMAQLLCGHCPVQQECLDHALIYDEPAGIWGGLTPHARTRLRHRQAS